MGIERMLLVLAGGGTAAPGVTVMLLVVLLRLVMAVVMVLVVCRGDAVGVAVQRAPVGLPAGQDPGPTVATVGLLVAPGAQWKLPGGSQLRREGSVPVVVGRARLPSVQAAPAVDAVEAVDIWTRTVGALVSVVRVEVAQCVVRLGVHRGCGAANLFPTCILERVSVLGFSPLSMKAWRNHLSLHQTNLK